MPGRPTTSPPDLRRSGYTDSRRNPVGYYQLHPNSIEIFPGTDSYFDQEAGVIKFAGGRISQIVSLPDNTSRGQYQLEPQLITNVSGPSREKRRMVRFADIPARAGGRRHLGRGQALLPARRLRPHPHHQGRLRRPQGGPQGPGRLHPEPCSSRACSGWTQDKRWTRKLAEVIITLQLEQKLSKEEIFEDYANQIYLGSRGSFRIHGFGEAAEVFLGKDLSQITLPEAAELAGLIRAGPPTSTPSAIPTTCATGATWSSA